MYTLFLILGVLALSLAYKLVPSGREFPSATEPTAKLADPVLPMTATPLPVVTPVQRVKALFAPAPRVDVNELRRHEHVLVPSKPGRPNRMPKEAVFMGISPRNPSRVVLLSGSGQPYQRRREDVLRRA
jgi:hypothetical protein